MHVLNNQPDISFQLMVSTSKGTHFFDPRDIIRLEASSNYTCIYFSNRLPLIISKILGNYEDVLTGYGFVRIHRSHLVNKSFVSFVDRAGNIFMKDASRVEISRRKRKQVIELLRVA
ncbi:MAG: LytTR family DNA-binding domain-containing protein [Ferruginibacter sp.]